MKTVGVIGHFGGNKTFHDGQTIKTKNLTELLCDDLGYQVYSVDTYLKRENKLLLLWRSFVCLIRCKVIFILLADKGMKFYLPFLFYLNRIFRRRIYHYIIGSELLGMVDENKRIVKYLNALEINWFEYDSGTEYLRNQGVKNAETLPNFKRIVPVSSVEMYESIEFRFLTFSRVMKEKGITEAVEAVAKINEKYGNKVCILDIYGPIEENYRDELLQLCNENSECVKYCGIAESEKSVQVFKEYFALLFPTHWAGEGFPGTIIDAFASGTPVIASDWNANAEIIMHMKTGIIYPREGIKSLFEAIDWAITNRDKLNKMRTACRKEFDRYEVTHIRTQIESRIGE